MLGKRKQTPHAAAQGGSQKKKWQEQLDNDSSAEEDDKLEAKLLEGDLSKEEYEKLKQKNGASNNKDDEADALDDDEVEYRKRRKFEEERQQKLIEAELEEEMKLRGAEKSQNQQPQIVEEQVGESIERDPESDERTIFVQNIHPDATEDDLDQIFKDFGKIKAIELMRVEGLTFNKGRAFVEFKSSEDAIKAVEAVNGKIDFKGKLLSVSLGLTGATKAKVEDKLIKQQQKLKEQEELEKDQQNSSENYSSNEGEEGSEGSNDEQEDEYEIVDTSSKGTARDGKQGQ